ncbi:hypothetical protein SAMN05216262_101679 [Colwellia chukchiensis]|uniref:Uncharacterized protein n=1 Tax=Colwellia chukchiensis TaxID=641665 RepID=A0A1H7I512_9GAMM|nr:hypothetical protein [Colwellia chukchiensis]SEK56550.1 hypothetical protein SAMN05216262_101679 [Colwellia chukchiensis]
MSVPLINTQDQRAMKAAFSMLSFPHKYFANPANITRLKTMFEGHDPAERLIELLNESQLKLANHMDFSSKDAEGYKRIKSVITDQTTNYVNVQSELRDDTSTTLTSAGIDNLISNVNMNVAELINNQQIKLNNGELDSGVVSEILDTAWVVQHFALLAAGTLRLEAQPDGSLIFKQMESGILTPTWFGDSLEYLSLKAATNAIASFAVATHQNEELMGESIQGLHARVLSIIPQHWRLGLGSRTLELFHEIADLVIFLVNVVQRKEIDKSEKPLSKGEVKRMIRQYPERKGLLKTYELIREFQKKNKPEDRLFDIRNGGLVLGPLKLVRGLIQQMEYFALKKQGPDWHSLLEKEQTRFLLDDLIKCNHLDVLEFELKPDKFDSSDYPDLRLDVDFFIRDKSINIVYAVQLKHVTTDTEAGLKSWFKLIGQEDKKLNTGILQLERLDEVVNNSSSAREYLIENGLTKDEILNLKPIVVHNIGSLDCITLHNGICLYDLYTFKKVLSGCWGSIEFYQNGYYESSFSKKNVNNSVDLSNPRNVIDAYIGEARFTEIKHFDGAKNITRSVMINGIKISAEGIGV